MKEGEEMKRGIWIGGEQTIALGGETGIEENRLQMLLCSWMWLTMDCSCKISRGNLIDIVAIHSSIQDCITSLFICHRRTNCDSLPVIVSSFSRTFLLQQALFLWTNDVAMGSFGCHLTVTTAKWRRARVQISIYEDSKPSCLHLTRIASWTDNDTPSSRIYLSSDVCLQYDKSYGQIPTQWGLWVMKRPDYFCCVFIIFCLFYVFSLLRSDWCSCVLFLFAIVVGLMTPTFSQCLGTLFALLLRHFPFFSLSSSWNYCAVLCFSAIRTCHSFPILSFKMPLMKFCAL